MSHPPGLDEESATRYSRDELWALRRFLLDGDGGPMRGLMLEAVPADEAAASRKPQRQERKQKPIGPITECVPVSSDILKANRDELRRIEKATGCLISEKAGLRNHTVIIQGTMSIVEKALPMVEAAFAGEAVPEEAPLAQRAVQPPPEHPPEPPSSAAASHTAAPPLEPPSSAGPPALPEAAAAPPRPAPPPPELPPPENPSAQRVQSQAAEDNLDEDWEIPAHWGTNAPMEAALPSAIEEVHPPQDLPWWHSPGANTDDGGFWEQESELPPAQPASSSSFPVVPSCHQPSSDVERQQDQEDRSWWNAVTSDDFSTNPDCGSAVQEVQQEAPRAPESRMAGRWRQNRAVPPPARAAPAPPAVQEPQQQLPPQPSPAFHPPPRAQQETFEAKEEDKEFVFESENFSTEDFGMEAVGEPAAPPPPAVSRPPPPVFAKEPPVAPSPSLASETIAPQAAPKAEAAVPAVAPPPPPPAASKPPPPAVKELPVRPAVKESPAPPSVKQPPAPPSQAVLLAQASSTADEAEPEADARREKCNGKDVKCGASPAELSSSKNTKDKKPTPQLAPKKAIPAKVKAAPTPKAKAVEKKLNAAPVVKAPPAKRQDPAVAPGSASLDDDDDASWEAVSKEQDVDKRDSVGGNDGDDDAMWDDDPFSTWYKSAASKPHPQSRPPQAATSAAEAAGPAPSGPSTGPSPERSQPKVVAKPPPPMLAQTAPEPEVEQAPIVTDNALDDLDLEDDTPGDKSKRKKKKKKKKGESIEEPAEPPKAAAKSSAKTASKAATAKAKANKGSSSLLGQHSHKTAFTGLVNDDSDSDEEDDAPPEEAPPPPPKAASSKAVAAKGAPAAKAARAASAASAEAPKAPASQKAAQPASAVASIKPPVVVKSPPSAVTAKPPPPLAEAPAAKASRPAPPPPPQLSSASSTSQSAWSGTRTALAQTRPTYEEDARLAARLQMEVDDDVQVVGPHASRQDPDQDFWGQVGSPARASAATAARGGAASAKAPARKEVSFVVTPTAKAPKAKAQAKVKALNPLPQRNNRAAAPAAVMYSHGMAISADNDNAASSRKWAERPVEKLVPVSRQEEEDDPELACYLWDRRAQKPLRDQARRAPAPVQAPPVYAKSSPAPNAMKQRHLLTKVCEMGFDEHSAKRALMQTGWAGVEEALGLLLG